MASTAPIQITQLFQCDICYANLAATSLRRQSRAVHGDKSSGKQWTCKVCEKSLQTKARLIQHEKSHGVNLQEKVFSLVKSASILLTTKDILQITKEGYTNPVRGCGCAWRAHAKTNLNHFSTIVCLWNIVKTMKMSPALSVKRLLGQRGICYATSRMYTKKRTMTKQEIQTAHKLT